MDHYANSIPTGRLLFRVRSSGYDNETLKKGGAYRPYTFTLSFGYVYEDFEVCAVWNAGPECLDECDRERAQANSKLIACAPEMLRTICRTYLFLLVKFSMHNANSTVVEIRIGLDGTLASLRNEISIATGLECQHIQDTFEDYAYKINAGEEIPAN